MAASNLRERRTILLLVFGVLFAVFIGRLFFLQVISQTYARDARGNATKRMVITPARGIVYDRHGRIYVANMPIFDLTLTPREVVVPDTLPFFAYLKLPRDTIRARLKAAQKSRSQKPLILAENLDENHYLRLQEYLRNCKGVNVVIHNARHYPYPVGANYLGYINEVDSTDIAESGGYYDRGDRIGRSGLERSYEQLLRGAKGVKWLIQDVHQREVGAYAGGAYDTLPVKGKDIMLSIDAELQHYAERLMHNKVGGVVAIEPESGEILTFVSSPHYDPNLLTGTEFPTNYRRIEGAPLRPLNNRALRGYYPPGSVFKLLVGAAALQEKTISPESYYGCAYGWARNGGKPACHGHPTPLAIEGAVQHSCNAFFAATYVDMLSHRKYASVREGFEVWRKYMDAFGIGRPLGVDIPFESGGRLPTQALYDKMYRGQWNGMTNVSNAIGQGEIIMTPLQMANVAAIFANRGWYVTPHFFKGLFNEPNADLPEFPRHRVPIDTAHFNRLVNGMEKVVSAGTGVGAQVPGIALCGKTGTSQNPHGTDHSVFIAFAPKADPKIAVAVVIENAGFGGEWAAPLAGLLIEKYLRGFIAPERQYREDYILNKDFITPRLAELDAKRALEQARGLALQ